MCVWDRIRCRRLIAAFCSVNNGRVDRIARPLLSRCNDTVSLDDIDSQLAVYCPTVVLFEARTEQTSLLAFSLHYTISITIFADIV